VATPFLERLVQTSRVVGVVTSPDRPVGRGYTLTAPAVKQTAIALGLPVQQPERLTDFSFLNAFGVSPDVGVVVAYGHLIPPAVFNQPRGGLVNIHFSMVPKYRGAGPIQWVLINGDRTTGVSLFQIEKGLDTGPVFLQTPVPIHSTDNAFTLRERLVVQGLALQDEFLKRWAEGPFSPVPQSGDPTFAPLLKKADGVIRWSQKSAQEMVCLLRGTSEWPGAWARLGDVRLRVRGAEVWEGNKKGPPGEILGVERGRGFLVQCREGSLLVTRVQPEGKKEMEAAGFWNGARLSVGDRFTEE